MTKNLNYCGLLVWRLICKVQLQNDGFQVIQVGTYIDCRLMDESVRKLMINAACILHTNEILML